jgi:hypothetical protein
MRRTNQIKHFYKLIHSIKMAKYTAYTYIDRDLSAYKMRTPYATPTPISRFTKNDQNARSSRHPAHERSHLKHSPPPEAFYHYEGRIKKKPRKKKVLPQQNEIQPTDYNQGPVLTTITPKTPQKSSCCTIL